MVPHQEKDKSPRVIKIGMPMSYNSNDTTSHKNERRVRLGVQNLRYVLYNDKALVPKLSFESSIN